jgi:hypothetical protein
MRTFRYYERRKKIAQRVGVSERTIKRKYKPDGYIGKIPVYNPERIEAEIRAEAEARQKAKAPAA